MKSPCGFRVSVAVLFVTLLVTAMSVTAQTPKASFDVITIKQSDPNAPDRMRGTGPSFPNEFWSKNVPLMQAVKFAYNIGMESDNQVVGAPGWVSSIKFDIVGKILDEKFIAETRKSPIGSMHDKVQPMVKALLEDRFRLQVHHETKELPAFVMTVLKSGSKLKPSEASPASTDETKPARPSGLFLRGRGRLEGVQATLEMLTTILGMQPEIGVRPLIDKTGLSGKFDFTLNWTPDGGTGSTSSDTGLSLFTALQEQLGIRLEATKAPVDVIVIDHVEMPSAN